MAQLHSGAGRGSTLVWRALADSFPPPIAGSMGFVSSDRCPLRKDAARDAVTGRGSLRLVLVGPHGSGKVSFAAGLARDFRLRMLVVDLRDVGNAAEVRDTLERAQVVTGLLGLFLYIHGVTLLAQQNPQLLRAMAETLSASRASFVVSLNAPLAQMHIAPLGARHIPLTLPSQESRVALWRSSLSMNDVQVESEEVERVATRFRLSAAQIQQAVSSTCEALPRGESRSITGEQLSAAARALCGDELARLAQRISPEATFDELIVNQEAEHNCASFVCASACARWCDGTGQAVASTHATLE